LFARFIGAACATQQPVERVRGFFRLFQVV